LIDRDFVELTNLQRQFLFDEKDAQRRLPKAVAAAEKLRAVNSEIIIEEVIADVTARNGERLISGADVILDGTDNLETRFLINDLALKTMRPWIYGAVLGSEGMTMTVVPRQTACLRCLIPDEPSSAAPPMKPRPGLSTQSSSGCSHQSGSGALFNLLNQALKNGVVKRPEQVPVDLPKQPSGIEVGGDDKPAPFAGSPG
jgi:molybdopterin/thiamine biosynthesis adenylyltransferase